jgi:hypothetical protein
VESRFGWPVGMGEVMARREVILGRAENAAQKQEIMERLLEVWKKNPQLRLGQLIGNIYHSNDRGGVSLYYAEDYALLTALEEGYKHGKTD